MPFILLYQYFNLEFLSFFLSLIQKYLIHCFPPHLSPSQYRYQLDHHYLCYFGYQFFLVILDFLSDIFHQFPIILILNILLCFTYMISLIRFSSINHIHLLYFIIFFLNIVCIFLRTKVSQFQDL